LTATHESVTWAVVYDRTAENATLEAASTALTSAIAADIYLGTSGYHSAITPWGYVNAETFSEGELLALNIELDASDKFDLVHDNPILLGLEIEYSRRKCVGTPIDIENTR